MLQGYTLDGSGAFRSRKRPPCTVWPRTVMRGELRKGNSGHNSVPKSARRTEPSPRNPRFAARPKGVAAQRRVWGSQEGAREPYGALAPFCPRRRAAAMHTPCHGEHPPSREGVNLASSGEPLYRRKVYRLPTVKRQRAPLRFLQKIIHRALTTSDVRIIMYSNIAQSDERGK